MPREPLKGILVLALEQAVAAPYAASRLADAGARVIKVERPEGDFARQYDRAVNGDSAYFVWLNRGKESLVADIKNDGDHALLHRILARADVFIQNLAPGAAARAGFGSADLRHRHPRLITVDISGYGEEGPFASRKAYDLLIQAETGLCAITGSPEAPGRVGVSVCDIAAGMYAHAAILEALLARGQTGTGSGIQVSLFDALADWMSVPYLQQVYTGKAPRRTGVNHPSIAPYGAYATGGGPVVFSIQNEREWRRFCDGVLQQPHLAIDSRFADVPARVANRAALDQIILGVFTALDRAAVAQRMERADIAFGALNDVAEFARHPQLRRTRVMAPHGPVDMIAPPAKIAGHAPAFGPVPEVGAHTDRIRKEFAA
ncbi:MAG: CoA transferase [Alphaproteobacteria bacterium]|nr:CoA transferase [Alphaproteobacteria bacterium]